MSQFAFNHVLFYGREYDEVLTMFALEESDLQGKSILDCPSGPDAFVAEAVRRGLDVTGCDPLYERSGEDILAQGMRDIAEGERACAAELQASANIDIAAFHETKRAALKAFAEDFSEGKNTGRYVSAALPDLPFPDNSFDLVLSANFLFAYAKNTQGGIAADETFDYDFHLASVRDLIRITRHELRMYPIIREDGSDRLNPYAARIMGQLAEDGLDLSLKVSNYEQSAISGNHLLVISKA